jgi:BolA protein
MRVADDMTARLTQAFVPSQLEVIDESHRHAGHAGARPGGETHFRVMIVSQAFAGKGRLERQRDVYAVLADLMRTDIHALSVRALTPEEADEASG